MINNVYNQFCCSFVVFVAQHGIFIGAGDEEKILAGLCIAVKDNINVKGFKTSAGTKALQNYAPEFDAPVVKKLRDAGAIMIGE